MPTSVGTPVVRIPFTVTNGAFVYNDALVMTTAEFAAIGNIAAVVGPIAATRFADWRAEVGRVHDPTIPELQDEIARLDQRKAEVQARIDAKTPKPGPNIGPNPIPIKVG